MRADISATGLARVRRGQNRVGTGRCAELRPAGSFLAPERNSGPLTTCSTHVSSAPQIFVSADHLDVARWTRRGAPLWNGAVRAPAGVGWDKVLQGWRPGEWSPALSRRATPPYHSAGRQ